MPMLWTPVALGPEPKAIPPTPPPMKSFSPSIAPRLAVLEDFCFRLILCFLGLLTRLFQREVQVGRRVLVVVDPADIDLVEAVGLFLSTSSGALDSNTGASPWLVRVMIGPNNSKTERARRWMVKLPAYQSKLRSHPVHEAFGEGFLPGLFSPSIGTAVSVASAMIATLLSKYVRLSSLSDFGMSASKG